MRAIPPPVHGKKRSFCRLSRALSAGKRGHWSQVLVFTSLRGGTKRRVTVTLFVLFSRHLGVLGPPDTGKRGKMHQ